MEKKRSGYLTAIPGILFMAGAWLMKSNIQAGKGPTSVFYIGIMLIVLAVIAAGIYFFLEQ